MKQSKIDIKVTGKRGNAPKWEEDKGAVTLFIDNTNSSNYINVDAFEGFGNNYKRRDKSLISIQINSNVWVGTIEELADRLNII